MNYRILTGDATQQLRAIASESVHCVVTSPPYWRLRNYGVDGQVGLEETLDEYVERLVQVFREVRRVLRPDGTVWLNLGDSYNGSGGAGGDYNKGGMREGQPKYRGGDAKNLKPKDLVGIPWRVAFALQDDGWWLRSEIVWAKKAPPPESVTDRPVRSHEKIFLLSKSARYFYDPEAVKEPSADMDRAMAGLKRSMGSSYNKYEHSVLAEACRRNQRDVWFLGPEPYMKAHFATFPTEVPRRCIKAGTSERGCCASCGAPWKRVTKREKFNTRDVEADRAKHAARTGRTDGYTLPSHGATDMVITVGWEPTCNCGASELKPCVVLDPFGGSGTTAAVAMELGRDAIIIELNPEYAELARERIEETIRRIKVGELKSKTKKTASRWSDPAQLKVLDLEIGGERDARGF